MTRETGYYWVKFDGIWMVAFYESQVGKAYPSKIPWAHIGDDRWSPESAFDEIGPRVPDPDSPAYSFEAIRDYAEKS